ncbi:DNA polymerase I [Novispirillum sp. DQ9]|uniref:DNA polymerase I n=1 Tax=Novispirillum sp. DQ9 TaxID=3398612 RepID=UPI003C7BE5EF
MKHLYLVDGSGFIFRAYHALPPLSTADGTPTNAVAGFTSMMLKLIEDTEADHVAVIFDAARKTFRNDIYPAYKAHRPPAPEDLIPQFPLIRDAVRAMNVACIEQDGFEADDLIATYARLGVEAGMEVTIVSSDKDLMQLVNDRVTLWDAMKNKAITRDQVIEKFGVPPEKVIDVQALCGDATDNVPGVPGIGIKTAATLIEEYGDLDTLLARAAEIKQPKRRQTLMENAEAARVSRQLVTLRQDVPVPAPLTDFAKRQPDAGTLLAFLEKMEFKRLLAQVKGRAAVATVDPQVAAAAPPSQTSYELVQDAAALRRWVAEATAAGAVAIDTETDALDARRCRMVGFSLATAPGRACYVPLRHVDPQGEADLLGGGGAAPKQIPVAEAVEILRPLLADPGVLKIGHNLKFDMHVLAGEGLEVSPVDDTMVLSYVLDGASHGHGMDELAALHLGYTCITYKSLCGTGKGAITFDKVPLDKACEYAAEDADVTLRLHRLFKERLLAERMVTVYETLDRPMIPVLFAMERAGIKVDALALRGLSDLFASRMAELEKVIHALAGEEFNVGSPKQLGEILFERMSLKGGKKSAKTGAWSTDANVLEELAGQGHDLPARVLDWRQVQKLKSTYTDTLTKQMDPATNRVHTTFGLTQTSTGRLSSSDPNLQNIPVRTEEGREIRRAFVAREGCVLLSADYSQIELRLVAHVADIPAMKQAFASGQDIHAITASQVFGVPVEGMDPMLRRRAKAINFGIIYGISAFGLARQLGIPNGEAKRFIDAYFARFPEIQTYMERTKAEGREHGFVRTALGRKCFVPGINEKNPAMRAFAERAAINAPIQGGAADIIKRAMALLPDALAEAGLDATMLLQVHDELVFEVATKDAEATAALVKQIMEGAATLSVPLEVDTGIATTWAEAH